jgi:predicted transposase YbfD/YdcC
MAMVVLEPRLWNKDNRKLKFYLTSLHCNAQFLGRVIHKHWGIENQAYR